jgi:hypothetical protein
MTQVTKPVEQVVAAIQGLDLDPIKLKLMDAEEGQGWSRAYVDRMELAYKRFLTLLVKFPGETIAPTKDVDKFWHGHILDTMKYAEDCQSVFGYFLHHFPYFGMRGEEDAANLRAAGENMHAIYQREFGEALPSGAAFCSAAPRADAAFCSARPAAAFCSAAPRADAAFCSARPAAAFCSAAPQASAFCSAALRADAAFCSARPASAFCSAAPQASAFCSAAPRAGAFCSASPETLNANVRPALPAAS